MQKQPQQQQLRQPQPPQQQQQQLQQQLLQLQQQQQHLVVQQQQVNTYFHLRPHFFNFEYPFLTDRPRPECHALFPAVKMNMFNIFLK